MMTDEKQSFILYHNFANQFALLSMEERGQLITALFEYSQTQRIQTSLSPLANMAFSCMKDTIDRDRDAYAERCRQNRENGKKGGRPRKSSFLPKTEGFFEKAKKPDKDNDNENDNENDNGIDNGTDRDNGRGYVEGAFCTDGVLTDEEAPPLSEEAPPLSEDAPPFLDDFLPFSEGASAMSSTLSEEQEKVLFEKGIPRSNQRSDGLYLVFFISLVSFKTVLQNFYYILFFLALSL